MLKEINLNTEAMPYLRSCLAQGDTISEYLLDLPLEQGKVSTFLPQTVNLSNIKKFEVGGITKKQQTYLTLARFICTYFKSNPNGLALFEAIEQLGDPSLALYSDILVAYHNEIYYTIKNDGYTLEQINRVLQQARAYPFIGILTSALKSANSIRKHLEAKELKQLATHTDYIFVGVYDDEGVLIWHKNSNHQIINTSFAHIDQV